MLDTHAVARSRTAAVRAGPQPSSARRTASRGRNGGPTPLNQLRTLQAEYEAWRDQAARGPGRLREDVCDLDLEALDVELPRGFGRD